MTYEKIVKMIPAEKREKVSETLIDIILKSKNDEKMPSGLANTILYHWNEASSKVTSIDRGIHQSGTRLHFFLPMEGSEHYWTAKIGVAGKAAYYCVSVTLLELLHQIMEKGQMYFPGLLEVKRVNLEISREALVHTLVPSHIAERAYKKIPKREVKEAKILASVSIPTDVELTPIVEFDEDKVKGFVVAGREVLAKYEVLAIATAKTKQKIEDAHIEEKNGKVFWAVTSNNKEMRFDLTTGELLEV